MPVSQFSMMSTPSASAAGVAPGHGVVAGGAAAALQRRAQHG
jgi:hypothetical protein